MKKITSALFFVAAALSIKAQCPDQSQMVMIAEDTNQVYNSGQTNVNTVPASMPCNTAMAFVIYPRSWGPGSGSIYQPCIRTRYNLYYTSLRNNLAEMFYQNGSLIYDLHPLNPLVPPVRRIGGTTPPASGGALWDFSLYQISALASHSISVCNAIGGPITTDSISIRDCWRNQPGPYVSNPAFATASPCLTWSDPANSGNISSQVQWSITPAAVWPAFGGFSNGTAYVDPRYLAPATYTVTYTFNTPSAGTPACGPVTANYIFTITNPYTATWTAPTNLCNTNGCVNLTTTGTPGGTWSGTGVSGSQFCPATSGAGTFPVTYTVGVSAACGASQANNITVNATPTISVAGGSICSGQSIVLTNTGPGAGSYTWSPTGGSANSATVSPTGTTTYTLTAANSNCTNSGTAVVNVTATPTLTATGGSVCSGQSIVLTSTGSASSYSWSPSGGTASTETVSPTGNTTYTLTGSTGACTGTATANVVVNATPTLTATGGTICAGQSIVLTSTGAATTYSWSPSGGTASTETVSPGGTATYTLTGANGTCTSSATAVVNVTPTPTVSISSSAGTTLCSGASTTLTAGGATNYTWSPNAGGGSTSPIVVTPGSTDTYTLTGETGGCTSTQVITVNVTPTPTVTASAGVPAVCLGSGTTITAGGATNYTLMPGGSTTNPFPVTPGGSTTYTITGETGGCVSTQTVDVTVNPLPVITLGAAPGSLCTGQTTTLTAGGATTYTWSANAGGGNTSPVSVTPGATDTYTVTGTDNNGCINSQTVTVNVGSGAVIGISATSNTVCVGQSITLNGSGAANYTWTPGGQTTGTITVNPGGGSTTYTLTGDNGGGCIGSETVTISGIANPTVTPSASSSAICSTGSTTLTASGATNYTWMPGGSTTTPITVNPGTTQTYTLTGETNGCTSNSTITINVTATPTVTANASGGTICAGQSVVLTGGGAGTYTWLPGGSTNGTVTVTPGGSTTYTLTGANGTCTASATASVTVTPLPVLTATTSAASICSGSPTGVVLTGGGATTYTWSTNAGGVNTSTASVNPGATDTYTVTGTTNGCTNSAQVSVTVVPTPTLSVSATTTAICAGQSTNINAGGASTYTWMPGGSNSASTSVSPVTTQNYTVTGETGGCAATATVDVIVNPSPILGVAAGIDTAKCGNSNGGILGVSVTGGTPGYTYQWLSAGPNNDSLTNVPAGSYTLIVTDANGCVATGGANVFTVPGTTPVSASINPILTQGQAPLSTSFTCTASGATTYNWTGAVGTGTLATNNYTAAGLYTVTVMASNAQGCWDTATAIVIIDQATVIVIPNIYSPNGDGINDVFFIFNTGLTSLKCDIFNRWGQHMATLEAPQAVWDGKTPNGSDASEGTYYYILKAVGVDGKTYEREGPLTLVR